ncbi:MAG TPA: hypothetical protein VM097_05875 [Mycobacteriales bacterium]|nr:hypothetical protein [Mycobacteriales bacterium]
MPMTTRVRAVLAAATVGLLPVLALATPGTAGAAAVEGAPSPCATLVLGGTCPSQEPTAEPDPTEEPTASPTPSPVPTSTAASSPTARRTSSPRPRSTYTPVTGSTEDPVTGTVVIGGVTGPTDQPTTSPKTEDRSSTSGNGLGRLLALTLGGAVLLGISGATGLYLTRHRHG